MKRGRKDSSDPYSFKYLNPKAPMRFAWKSIGVTCNNAIGIEHLGAKSDFSSDSDFPEKGAVAKIIL